MLLTRFVFLKPPSLEVLEARLRDRGTETEESLSKVKVIITWLTSTAVNMTMTSDSLYDQSTETEESLSKVGHHYMMSDDLWQSIWPWTLNNKPRLAGNVMTAALTLNKRNHDQWPQNFTLKWRLYALNMASLLYLLSGWAQLPRRWSTERRGAHSTRSSPTTIWRKLTRHCATLSCPRSRLLKGLRMHPNI